MDLLLQRLDTPVAALQYTPPAGRSFRETVNVQAAKYILTLSQAEFEDQFVDAEFREFRCRTKSDAAGHFQMMRALCSTFVGCNGDHRPTYKYGQGSDSGRIYVDGRGGAQRVSCGVRNMLVTPDMVDYDMCNAHPTILLWVYKSLGLCAHFLDEYVTDRAGVLERTGKTKRDILCLMNKDSNRKKDEGQWVCGFIQELKANKAAIHGIVQAGFTTCNQRNPVSSVVNMLLCSIENCLLQSAIDAFALTHDGSKVIPMYDGFMSDTAISVDDLNAHTAELGVTWKVKEWTQTAVPEFVEQPDESYEAVKARFERDFFIVEEPLMFNIKGKFVPRSDFIDRARPYKFRAASEDGKKGRMKCIFDAWMEDPHKRHYERVTSEPYNPLEGDPTDARTLNEAVPFRFQYIEDEEQRAGAIDDLRYILRHLTTRDEEAGYVLGYLS